MKPNIGDTIITIDDYGVVTGSYGQYGNNIIYQSIKDNEKKVVFYGSIEKIIARTSNEELEKMLDEVNNLKSKEEK